MQPEAVIIPAVTAVAFAAGIGVMLYQSRSAQPDKWYAGIGVKFNGHSDASMRGVDVACQAIIDVVKSDYPDILDKLIPNLWVYFYGPNDTITSTAFPEGKVYHSDGTPAVLMGTSEQVRITPFSSEVIVSKVRDRLPSEPAVRLAGATALFHEVGQHVVPFLKAGDWNADHKVGWMLVEQKMQDRYRALGGPWQ